MSGYSDPDHDFIGHDRSRCVLSYDEEEELCESPPCPACDGEQSEELGTLGNLIHYRCRCCGAQFNTGPTS